MNERNIILTRHLDTQYNTSGSLMGREIDLEIKNDENVDILISKIAMASNSMDIKAANTLLVSSPLRRCIQTSQVIAKALHLPENILLISELTETDMGDFTGKEISKLRSEYGELIDQWMHEPENFTFPGGESYKDVKKRVKIAMEKLRKEIFMNHYQNIFVCTHVDIIKMLLFEILGVSFNERRKISIPNGSISKIAINREKEMQILGINIFPNLKL